MIQDFFLLLIDWWRTTVVLRSRKQSPLFKEGELWWCSIGLNIGTEIFGKGKKFTRPVLIFKKFNSNSFLGIPLTSQSKTGIWYVSISRGDQKNVCILSQIRVFDGKRLIQRMGTVSNDNFENIRKSFLRFYGS